MILLMLFAFLAGVVTILSPCVLPVLPIVLSSTIGGKNTGKSRPIGIIVGFIASFTFFTLFLSTIVKLSAISSDLLRTISVFIIAGFGVTLVIPRFQLELEKLFSKTVRFLPQGSTKIGFWSGFLIGLSLGLLWTPCVGPILASVISLAITGTVTLDTFVITLAYSAGTAVPLFLIMNGGQNILQKIPWLIKNTSSIQKTFGIIMIVTAIGIFFNIDRTFQTYILNTFPQYGVGLTKIEDNPLVKNELAKISKKNIDAPAIGKPFSNVALTNGPIAPEIIPGGVWFNSKPLTLAKLKGKVVIIDFWTYTCINCQRTFPYVKEWWEKYKDKGLVIIGVHAPEFEFEKDKNNLVKAISDFGLTYPIVQDNNYETWQAYNNQYWPAKYIIDKNGIIRYAHFGEGDYDETEKDIQNLLKETGAKNIPSSVNNPSSQIYAITQETYLGSNRIDNFSSPEPIQNNMFSFYTSPSDLPDNTFGLQGEWDIEKDHATPKNGSQLFFNFDAAQVFLVMKTGVKPTKIKVYVDNKMQYFGEDNINGIVTVNSDRLYKLVFLPTPGKHMLKLEFEDSNAQLFAFTFG